MRLDAKIESRFQQLLKQGESIMGEYLDGEGGWRSWPSDWLLSEWCTSIKNSIEKACGKDSVYHREIENLYTNRNIKVGLRDIFLSCIGVLRAAYTDLQAGLLEDTKALITADVFTNFIEQAEYLLEEGYKLPSAVLVGAVLEDGLRTLCKKNGTSLSKRPKLDWMNAELTKVGVYNKNVQKQVTAWAGIRNSAAHGKPDEFTDTDVKNMISGVIDFNATYLR